MKVFKKAVQATGACALAFWLAAPAAAQLDLGVGGGADANVNPGGVVNGAGNAVQNATQGVQRAVQGVERNVQQGAQQAAQGARNLARESAQRTQQGVQNLRNRAAGQTQQLGNAVNRNLGLNAGTWSDSPIPQVPARVQANANVNAQASRDARWRRMQHNGEWWYYGPDDNWMYYRDGEWNKYDQQNFQPPRNQNRNQRANYRGGANADVRTRQDGQSVYRIRSDANGSQYINLDGRRLYVESGVNASVGGNQ